jgi:GNAT superfamily N-acetyltransferase
VRAEADRRAEWALRFEKPDDRLFVQLAHDGAALGGFSCVFLDAHPVWDALLDNLHVTQAFKNQGVGSRLLVAAAEWCETQRPGGGVHLWVYERNVEARRFYERFGAREIESVITELPGGGSAVIIRYGWPLAADALRVSARRTRS